MYNYEQIKGYLAPNIIENLVCVFKTGSQLFCENCKDYDYVVITKEEINLPCFHINELKADFFVMSIETLNRRLQDNQWRYKLSVCMAKADSSNIIYGELPELEVDIMSSDYLLKILQIEYEFGLKTYYAKRGASKTIVWGMALYYIISNGAFIFTDAQLAEMQQYHDNNIGDSFLVYLKAGMERLLTKF